MSLQTNLGQAPLICQQAVWVPAKLGFMEAQHTVPKSYLKNFCRDGVHLFASRFLSEQNHWTAPKAYSTTEICKAINYYDFSEPQAKRLQLPTDHLERNVFWYEGSFIASLVANILKGQVSEVSAEDVGAFVLSMKQRNPKFRAAYSKLSPEALDSAKKQVTAEFSFVDDVGLDIATLVEQVAARFAKSSSEDDFHRESILRSHAGNNPPFQAVLDRLRHFNLLLFRIAEGDPIQFISSDCPGYSVDLHGNFHFMKYTSDQYHFMPLSPQVAVALVSPVIALAPDRAGVVYRPTPSEVHQLNFGTAVVRNEFVYSATREGLARFIETVFSRTG